MQRCKAACLLAIAVVSLLGGCGSDEGTSSTSTTGVEASSTTAAAGSEVVKDVLGEVADPPGAQGSTLTLIRYTIPAGAKLSPHIHPGVQLARIEEGSLSYTIESGTATVRRAGADTDEEVTGPTTITLDAGDTVTELDGMVHFGANDTDEQIVIVATLLTADGEDLAVAVTEPEG